MWVYMTQIYHAIESKSSQITLTPPAPIVLLLEFHLLNICGCTQLLVINPLG